MTDLVRDLRFGARLLAKSPVFTVTAAVLLAIGISANTLIFSVIDAWMLRPLPVSHPESLVRLIEIHPNDFITWDLPYNLCESALPSNASLSEMICQGEADVPLSDGASTERIRAHLVSPNFFSSLGVHAHLGRVLNADDERAMARNAVLSHTFWSRRFARDTSILGRSIILRGHSFTVVGVSPEGFNGLSVDTSPDIRVPASTDRLLVTRLPEMKPNARPLWSQIFGRLRDGASIERAAGEIESLLRPAYQQEMDRIFPPGKDNVPIRDVMASRLRLEPVSNGVSNLRAQFSPGLTVLMSGVALLLLMTCANVAGLLLARSTVRAQEMGIRLALGASRGRIVRQLLTEGLILGLLGGIGGILLSHAALPLLTRGLPQVRDRAAVLHPLAVHIDIDLRALGFSLLITLSTVVLFALAPALQSARSELATTLRSSRSTARRWLPRNVIVTAQVALCTVILIGAVLLMQTLERMRSMNPGFDRDHVVTFTIDPGLKGYSPQNSRALSKTLLERARQLPGVVAAGLATRGVMRGTGIKATFGPAGARIQPSDFLNTSLNGITPGYFESMGMRMVAGRDFNWFDRTETSPGKAIVNQAFASRFFPGRNPIGERYGSPGAGSIARASSEIIGVVSDAKYRSLREPIPPTAYGPIIDGFDSGFVLHVRTSQRPETMIAPVRTLLRSLDPELPFIEVHTLREEVEASLWQERLLAGLSMIFGGIAVLVASLGLYSALDYAVKSRTREIGVRVAVGAEPARIIRLLGREVLLLVSCGAVLGLCAYAGAAVWIRSALYQVSTWDPLGIASVLVTIAVVAAVAVAPAIYRAVRIDPASALRAD